MHLHLPIHDLLWWCYRGLAWTGTTHWPNYLLCTSATHMHLHLPIHHDLLWQCDGGLAWTSTMHIDQCHTHSSTMTQHHIHPYWPALHTFINHDPALHTSICTFLNTYNGPTWTGSLVSPHKSLLPWAQSTANWIYHRILSLRWYGYIINFYWTVCENT